MFCVTFLGFFCYLDPSAENVQRFFVFTVLGALIYIRRYVLSPEWQPNLPPPSRSPAVLDDGNAVEPSL